MRAYSGRQEKQLLIVPFLPRHTPSFQPGAIPDSQAQGSIRDEARRHGERPFLRHCFCLKRSTRCRAGIPPPETPRSRLLPSHKARSPPRTRAFHAHPGPFETVGSLRLRATVFPLRPGQRPAKPATEQQRSLPLAFASRRPDRDFEISLLLPFI